MRNLVLVLISVASLAVTSLAQDECHGKPDGSYGYGCRSYTRCVNGTGTIIDCPVPDYAYDYRSQQCELASTVPPPCGDMGTDCSNTADGLYPVLPDCKYFYTCNEGQFLGASPCNNPPDQGDLRFDEDLKVCNWIWAVKAPCGTMVPRGRLADN
jgi:hypothetical protein